MTTDVITMPDDASIAEVVELLTDREISAVPIADRFDVVVGLVSWSDLHGKIEIGASDGASRSGGWRRWVPGLVQWPEGTVAEVMSGPALTIGADASLPAAARVMHRAGVGRLLVVDDDNELRGIVTRSDLLKVHGRPDAVIREEVRQRILTPPLQIEPGAVQVAVDEGVVTLTGHTVRRSTAVAAAGLTETVPGVTDVDDRLTYDVDDTAPRAAEKANTRRAARPHFRGLVRRPHRAAESQAAAR
jgi:CBS-domain-containing membrane protein